MERVLEHIHTDSASCDACTPCCFGTLGQQPGESKRSSIDCASPRRRHRATSMLRRSYVGAAPVRIAIVSCSVPRGVCDSSLRHHGGGMSIRFEVLLASGNPWGNPNNTQPNRERRRTPEHHPKKRTRGQSPHARTNPNTRTRENETASRRTGTRGARTRTPGERTSSRTPQTQRAHPNNNRTPQNRVEMLVGTPWPP